MKDHILRAAAAAALVVIAAATLTACSTENRSVEAFCSTMDTHKERYLAQMNAAQGGDLLGGLMTAVAAVGDLKVMWRELADVAPAEIQTDTEVVRDAWEQQEENAAGMDWAAALATGILNSGSMSRVDTYVRENCGGDYAVAPAGEQTGQEPEATEPPAPTPPILTDSWANTDGYTYTFELDEPVPTTSVEIANAKPGEALVTWSYSMTGTIANTTSSRNAPATGVKVQAFWPAGSLVCSITGGNVVVAFSSNTDGREAQWCTLSNFPMTLAADSPIPEGTAVPVQSAWGGMYPLVIAEADVDALVAELEAPHGWAVARNEGDGRLTDCLLESGSWYLSKATVDTGCTP